MKHLPYLLALFIVSWPVGVKYELFKCTGKEPEGIVCAKPLEDRKERTFKTEEAANEFAAMLKESKIDKVTVQKK